MANLAFIGVLLILSCKFSVAETTLTETKINIDASALNKFGEREYLMYVPEGLRTRKEKSTRVTLFVALHGGSNTAKHYFYTTDLYMVAEDKQDFILLFPQGHCDSYTLCCWNSGHVRGLHQPDWYSTNDVEFLDDLITFILGEFPEIDDIVMLGFSSGAFMSYTYAINTTVHQIHTVIPVSGTIGGISAEFQQPEVVYDPNDWGATFKTNVIHIHGKKDEVVPIDGGYTQTRYDMSMLDCIKFWMETNGCLGTQHPMEIDLEGNAELTKYGVYCEDGMEVYSLVFKNVGHAWGSFTGELEAYQKDTFAMYSETLGELIYNLWKTVVVGNPLPEHDPDPIPPDDGCDPLKYFAWTCEYFNSGADSNTRISLQGVVCTVLLSLLMALLYY
jgi:poly(3-hydroxybutyrate) depolymerase